MPRLWKLYQQTKQTEKHTNVQAYNLEQRKLLVQHALSSSVFYKELYTDREGNPLSVQSEEDFTALPVLTREALAANFDTIRISKYKGVRRRTAKTSGSTGPSVTVMHDQRNPETPIRWRILEWWGVEPWENQAFIYRFKKSFWEELLSEFRWWPTQRVFLAAADLNQKKLDRFVNRFNKIKPALLQGYVDVVFEFALYVLDNNIQLHAPKVVWVTSAPLFPEQRELMEKAFGAPVCDQYGNTEILLIAAECPEQNGLHMMHDRVFVEFVDEHNQPVPSNTTGRILLTDLTNYVFPIIRYDIGDEGKAIATNCACGRVLPLMDNVKGRQAFVLKTPSGLTIKGEHVMAMFKGYMKSFKHIQLVQEADYSVVLHYIPRDDDKVQANIAHMQEAIAKRARGELKVTTAEVTSITKRGIKYPVIISKL